LARAVLPPHMRPAADRTCDLLELALAPVAMHLAAAVVAATVIDPNPLIARSVVVAISAIC
jgi:hypothetical protein